MMHVRAFQMSGVHFIGKMAGMKNAKGRGSEVARLTSTPSLCPSFWTVLPLVVIWTPSVGVSVAAPGTLCNTRQTKEYSPQRRKLLFSIVFNLASTRTLSWSLTSSTFFSALSNAISCSGGRNSVSHKYFFQIP